MNITSGKNYVRRNGTITNILEDHEHSLFAFKEIGSAFIYTKLGKGGAGHGLSKYDIVAEHHANRPTVIGQR